ncbi:MAG: dihydrolipoyl dehydrogenase [Pyramidobacter sp.]|nr:dihydrolipoyl dehydrogenase [Pyramidobacter sp.]
MSSKKVIVIGGGPGGYVCAVRLAQLGCGVTLIEKRDIGGTCLNRGCIPTKSLLHSADLWSELHDMPLSGIRVDTYEFSWSTMQRRKDHIVAKLRGGVERLLKKWNVNVKRGSATVDTNGNVAFFGANGNETLTADAIVIATGTEPAMVPLPLPDGYTPMTTDDLLGIKELPNRLAIIGGGVIGVEMASVFARLGTKVEIIELLPEILAQLDADLGAFAESEFVKSGIGINKAAKTVSITGKKGDLKITLDSGKVIEADDILVAVGRRPHTEGLDEAGINLDRRGYIQVDEHLQTSRTGVYAIGDVTGRVQLAHVASAQGVCCAEAVAGKPYDMDYSVVPSCVFSSPELASVGLTEKQAREQGISVKVAKYPFAASGKAMAEGDMAGFIKLIADEADGKIIGVHVAGGAADTIIHEGALAVYLGATAEQLARMIHAHPTRSEGIAEAAEHILGHSIHF